MKEAGKSASNSPRPVYSMTGFARTTGRISELVGFTLSLKSVNHRFLDLHLRLPGNTDALEMELRRELKARVSRGHVEVTLNLDRTAKNELTYDATQLAAYLEIFRTAAADHGLVCEPDLNEILRMPGVFGENRGERNFEEEAKATETAVMAVLPSLVDALNEMRAREGSALSAELRAGLDRLESLVAEASALREGVQQAYFERLAQRLQAMVGESFDPQRVLQEAALLAEKSDVEEEVARLRAHIGHFRELLAQGGEIGKKLDFLLQEMNREANTLLSKTGGVAGNGPRVTEIGLGMKAEIERAREQIQNLE